MSGAAGTKPRGRYIGGKWRRPVQVAVSVITCGPAPPRRVVVWGWEIPSPKFHTTLVVHRRLLVDHLLEWRVTDPWTGAMVAHGATAHDAYRAWRRTSREITLSEWETAREVSLTLYAERDAEVRARA